MHVLIHFLIDYLYAAAIMASLKNSGTFVSDLKKQAWKLFFEELELDDDSMPIHTTPDDGCLTSEKGTSKP